MVLGVGYWVSGLWALGFGYRVLGLWVVVGFEVFGLRMQGSGSRIWGLGFGV